MHYKLKDFPHGKYIPYFTDYSSLPYNGISDPCDKVLNKLDIPCHRFEWDDAEEFNKICKSIIDLIDKLELVKGFLTPSGGIKSCLRNKVFDCYYIYETKKYYELIITSSKYGCYRFTIGQFNKNDKNKNAVSGQRAVSIIYQIAERYGVLDTFKNNTVDRETGLAIKNNEIKKAKIEVEKEEYLGQEFNNAHHLDLNSSYASRIVEAFPELRPMYQELYDKRKDNNGRYKSVLNNSIGAFQSTYCIDIDGYGRASYQMTKFSKIAVNGTVDKILEIRDKMLEQGFKPLLYNTDGIWYTSNDGTMYHDNEEGPDLCQWKHDHTNCKLYIKSAGAYQYIEDNKVNTVLRGSTRLDRIKPREEWEWREIDSADAAPFHYKLDLSKGGIIKVNDEGEEIE